MSSRPGHGRNSYDHLRIADLFISADGFAKGEHSPGYFGPDLERWITEEQVRQPQHVLMGRRTYELLAGLPEEPVTTATGP